MKAKVEVDTAKENVRTPVKVQGGNVLVIGDLHFSSSYEGQHIDYTYECYTNMERIAAIVKAEKPSCIIFLGDLMGVSERQIKDRQFLMRVIMFFNYLNEKTKGRVYSVKGNHDFGDFTDFDMLIGLGLCKNPKYVDYFGKNGLEIRFHLVNYGDEKKPLELSKEEDCASDVVLGHAEYYIDGVTNWYSAKNGLEVSQLKNFCGVSLIFSGHIHTPSDEVLYANMYDGSTVGLFYPGSPSRTAERFDDCWYIIFKYSEDEDQSDYEAKLFGLESADKVFYPKETIINEEGYSEEDEQKNNADKLTEIVREIMESRLTAGDIEHQINIIPGADQETKDMAIDYYRKAVKGE